MKRIDGLAVIAIGKCFDLGGSLRNVVAVVMGCDDDDAAEYGTYSSTLITRLLRTRYTGAVVWRQTFGRTAGSVT